MIAGVVWICEVIGRIANGEEINFEVDVDWPGKSVLVRK